jgi:hypothetical protein
MWVATGHCDSHVLVLGSQSRPWCRETTIVCTIAGATCGKEGVCARTARGIGGVPSVEEAMGEG